MRGFEIRGFEKRWGKDEIVPDWGNEPHQETEYLSTAECPECGWPMPDLKGGRESVCRNCGFKDCCG